MNAHCLSLDVGGTFIKEGIMDGDCAPLPGSVRQIPVNSLGDAPTILEAFDAALCMGMEDARAKGVILDRISVSIPGPFNYPQGISRMRHKFASIENYSLREHFVSVVGDLPIVFLHDGVAFMLGECFFGAGKSALRPVGVMLGTGFGFTTLQQGKVSVNEVGTPALSLYARLFRDGVTEDYISSRAIRARYAAKRPEKGNPDVRTICEYARCGDQEAIATMEETGALLAEALAPHLEALRCDRVIVGGQIARSMDLLMPGFLGRCRVPICTAAWLEDAALRGAAYFAQNERSDVLREMDEEGMIKLAKEG